MARMSQYKAQFEERDAPYGADRKDALRTSISRILDLIAFPASRSEVLETARSHYASSQAISVLEQLPAHHRFVHADAIWEACGYAQPAQPAAADPGNALDPADIAYRVREAIDASGDIDAARIEVALSRGSIALQGWVATEEESAAAWEIATGAADGLTIANSIRVDPGLREGVTQPFVGEAIDLRQEDELASATEFSAPAVSQPWTNDDEELDASWSWSPPEVPHGLQLEREPEWDDAELIIPAEQLPSAPDLDADDLRRFGKGIVDRTPY